MKGIKICKRCNKKIGISDKATLLHTFEGNKTIEKVYWHFDCFLAWRDESINIRAANIINSSFAQAIDQAIPMLEAIKENKKELVITSN